MSLYQFFASNRKLEEYDNQRIVLDSKKQILKGRRGKVSILDERNAIRILVEDDKECMNLYTDKKYGAFLEWNYTDKNAEEILCYISNHLKKTREIELWNVWLGSKEQIKIKKCCVDNLSIADIKNIWGQEFFKNAECLKIYRR